jgi:hypothetical protein
MADGYAEIIRSNDVVTVWTAPIAEVIRLRIGVTGSIPTVGVGTTTTGEVRLGPGFPKRSGLYL